MKPYYQTDQISIYNCDNLDLLRHLEDESVNLIYCDILYNTGKAFDDYNDNLGSPAEAIEWYRPRFIEMKRVLAADGSIFIHCNWRLDSYIRILMDETFGVANFRNRIYRKHSKERGFYKNFDSQVDIILYYVKDPNNFVFNELHSDKPTIVPLFENGYIEGRSEPRWCEGKCISFEGKNKHWLVSPDEFNTMIYNGEVKFIGSLPSRSSTVQPIDSLPYRFSTVRPIGNLWADDEMLDQYDRTATASTYDTPKPDAILERIIEMCTRPFDTVADFFMGGGTTAVVAQKLCRTGIFCDISEKACDVAISKLKALNN